MKITKYNNDLTLNGSGTLTFTKNDACWNFEGFGSDARPIASAGIKFKNFHHYGFASDTGFFRKLRACWYLWKWLTVSQPNS